MAKLQPDSYTYVSSTESCGTSWLDHLIVSDAETVTMIDIKYGFKFCDHIPLIFGINVNCVVENIKVPAFHYEFVLWARTPTQRTCTARFLTLLAKAKLFQHF